MTAVEQAPGGFVGRSMKRKEDPRLITGRATYVDDMTPVGTLWVAFVRSPEAHAKITSVDASGALERDDVVAVFTNEDMSDLQGPLPMAWVPPGVELNVPEHWPLARGEVCHVGDPVAVVIGEDRYGVVDAAEQVVVEYEPLPVVTDPEAALRDETLVHADLSSNKVHEWSLGVGEEALQAGFDQAEVVIERRIRNHRTAGGAIEPRAVLAEERAGHITVWSSTQVPHFLRLFLAILLGLSEERVRVSRPEVGGGFGSKLQIYGEEILCAWAARRLGRPVKWCETRSEAMAVTHHGRDQIADVRVGAKRDGTVTAFHAKILADLGAYMMLLTPTIPSLGAFVMSGCYRFPAVQTDITGVMTNKFATDAIRGAGRPEATHMIEVALDQLAHELGLDPLDVRRRNFIPADAFPYETAIGVVYDSGNYQGTLAKLLEHVDVAEFRSEQERLRGEGTYRGIGFSTYTEICGLAPSRVVGPGGFGLQAGGWESALVRVHLTGTVTVYTGTSPHGQGHETGVRADRGRPPRRRSRAGRDHPRRHRHRPQRARHVRLAHAGGRRRGGRPGDGEGRREGQGVRRAQARGGARGHRGRRREVRGRGPPDKGMTLAEVAGARLHPRDMPEGMEPGLEEPPFYDPENFVVPVRRARGVVDVDAETGKVERRALRRGRRLRPGDQPDAHRRPGARRRRARDRAGAVRAGLYDEAGQLVTGTFVDYALPTRGRVPSFETDRTETPRR